MEDKEQVLQDTLASLGHIKETLDRLVRRVADLSSRLEMAEIHPLETMSTPQDFNEGPPLPGLG